MDEIRSLKKKYLKLNEHPWHSLLVLAQSIEQEDDRWKKTKTHNFANFVMLVQTAWWICHWSWVEWGRSIWVGILGQDPLSSCHAYRPWSHPFQTDTNTSAVWCGIRASVRAIPELSKILDYPSVIHHAATIKFHNWLHRQELTNASSRNGAQGGWLLGSQWSMSSNLNSIFF